jgi:hypothetical protein
MRQGLATVLKIVAGLAGLVALLAPMTTGTGWLIIGVAALVAIITGVIGAHLSDDDQGQSGYWPQDLIPMWFRSLLCSARSA